MVKRNTSRHRVAAVGLAGLLLFGCSALASESSSGTSEGHIANYDQCVRAGYPTGRLGTQERCWTPNLAEIFVKGLEPTIQQGVYGTIVLRTGDCMPRGVDSPSDPPCQYRPISARLYVVTYNGKYPIPVVTNEPPERVFKVHKPLKIAQADNGIYEISLPEGSYLILAEYEGRLWSTGIAFVRSKPSARDTIDDQQGHRLIFLQRARVGQLSSQFLYKGSIINLRVSSVRF